MMQQYLYVCVVIYVATSAEKVIDLNGHWVLDEINGKYRNVEATVPGGVYSDLMNNKIISDIFYGYNDTATRWVAKTNWTYQRNFTVDQDFLNYSSINLVFDGLDTFSTIYLNGNAVGSSSNMFLRYIIDIKPYLKSGNNTVAVKFLSPILVAQNLSSHTQYSIPPLCPAKQYRGECHVNQIRKMQASFGWDWGPAIPSMGIWKKVYLEGYDSAVVRYLSADTRQINADAWIVNVTVHLSVSRSSSTLQATLVHRLRTDTIIIQEVMHLNLTNGGNIATSYTITVPALSIKRWWPNGYGSQNLYHLSTTLSRGDEKCARNIRIAFRKIELVQSDLGGGMDFYLSVNDLSIFAKGSNEIPLSILPERGQNPQLIERTLRNAKYANMNMLRVWGGGVYESDHFYDKADEFGILIWQDFMFACAMYPVDETFLANVEAEVRHQVRRLRHHASIALWAGNNENELALVSNWFSTRQNFTLYKKDYVTLYVATIRRVLLQEAPDAIFLTSSPTNGKESDAEGFVAKEPGSSLFGDVHYYNYVLNPLSSVTYPIPRFVSEAGYQSFPAVDSWLTATHNISNLSPFSDFMDHRQHHPFGLGQNNLLMNYQFKINYTSEDLYKSYIFHSQLIQALSVKFEVEMYRSFMGRMDNKGQGNTMGALYWQLNDVWVGPTWSGVDYTGRWKMLQYFTRDFFAATIVTGYLDTQRRLNIFGISEQLSQISFPLKASLLVTVYKWNSFDPINTTKYESPLIFGKSVNFATISTDDFLNEIGCGSLRDARYNCFFLFSLRYGDQVHIAPDNFLVPTNFKYALLPNAIVTIGGIKQIDSDGNEFKITVSTNKIAFFVWLDAHQILGKFSENAFLQLQPNKSVVFTCDSRTTVDLLRNELTVTHLKDQAYL